MWNQLVRMGLGSIVLAVTMDSFVVAQTSSGPVEEAAVIVAMQVRKQGHTCSEPLSAQRDHGASMPNQAAWTLTCANATYRVRLVPKKAAHVERFK